MKTKLFVDFDGTLFNTALSRAKIFEIFEKAGFSILEIERTYKAECLNYRYNPFGQIKRLQEIRDFNVELTKSRLNNLYKTTSKFLYTDSINFLRSIDKEKYYLNLLTLGDANFQKLKVEQSEIASFFDNLYYTEIQKWDFFDQLVDLNEKFILIDDRGDTDFNVSKKFKRSFCIKITRPQIDNDDPFLNVESRFNGIKVKNLDQVLKYL